MSASVVRERVMHARAIGAPSPIRFVLFFEVLESLPVSHGPNADSQKCGRRRGEPRRLRT